MEYCAYDQRKVVLHFTLAHAVGQYDVVFSDLDTSWKIPAFSGKVIASYNPVHWVGDMDKRRSDTHKFFAAETVYDERIAILKRYNVDYLLVDKKIPSLMIAITHLVKLFMTISLMNLSSLREMAKEIILLNPDIGVCSHI